MTIKDLLSTDDNRLPARQEELLLETRAKALIIPGEILIFECVDNFDEFPRIRVWVLTTEKGEGRLFYKPSDAVAARALMGIDAPWDEKVNEHRKAGNYYRSDPKLRFLAANQKTGHGLRLNNIKYESLFDK